MLLEILAVPAVLMIDILIAYNVNKQPSELVKSAVSVDVFSAANVSVTSFPEFSHEVA